MVSLIEVSAEFFSFEKLILHEKLVEGAGARDKRFIAL